MDSAVTEVSLVHIDNCCNCTSKPLDLTKGGPTTNFPPGPPPHMEHGPPTQMGENDPELSVLDLLPRGISSE